MAEQMMFANLPHVSTNNNILDSLPQECFERLIPDFESVQLTRGEIIHRAEEPITHLYFPKTAIISVIAKTLQGQSVEVGVIGREGIAGMDVLLGSDRTLYDNIIQVPGIGLRIGTSAIKKEFERKEEFHDLALQFIRLMTIQISQTALCNRLHSAEERLSRWVLMCHDRAEDDELNITQESLGVTLGANRVTVTLSSIALQNAGFINYHRGDITVTNRTGLEDFACECHRVVKAEYDRTFQKQSL